MGLFVVGPSRSPLMRLVRELEAKERGPASKSVAKPEVGFPKENAVRSEAYRRFVASQPCSYCTAEKHSQAAHPPPSGKGIKESDIECFPLCTVRRVGRKTVEGCHKRFDNYELIPKEKMAATIKKWIRQTQAKAIAAGAWPKGVPLPAWSKKK